MVHMTVAPGDIFISYARTDFAVAKRIARELEGHNLPVWWDNRLDPGHQFRETITARIDQAARVIVIWSPTSVNSGFVLDEASRANQQNKLLPIAIMGAQPPLGFGHLHTLQIADINKDIDRIIAVARGAAPPFAVHSQKSSHLVPLAKRVGLRWPAALVSIVGLGAAATAVVDQRQIDALQNWYRYGSELNYVTYRSKTQGVEFVYPMRRLTLDTTKEGSRRWPLLNSKGEVEVEIYRSELPKHRDPVIGSAEEQRRLTNAGLVINYVAPQVSPEKKNWYVISGRHQDGKDHYLRRWYMAGDVVSVEYRVEPELKALYDKIIADMTLGGIKLRDLD
jgi:TIR domain